jgi:hypothetical protein
MTSIRKLELHCNRNQLMHSYCSHRELGDRGAGSTDDR